MIKKETTKFCVPETYQAKATAIHRDMCTDVRCGDHYSWIKWQLIRKWNK